MERFNREFKGTENKGERTSNERFFFAIKKFTFPIFVSCIHSSWPIMHVTFIAFALPSGRLIKKPGVSLQMMMIMACVRACTKRYREIP